MLICPATARSDGLRPAGRDGGPQPSGAAGLSRLRHPLPHVGTPGTQRTARWRKQCNGSGHPLQPAAPCRRRASAVRAMQQRRRAPTRALDHGRIDAAPGHRQRRPDLPAVGGRVVQGVQLALDHVVLHIKGQALGLRDVPARNVRGWCAVWQAPAPGALHTPRPLAGCVHCSGASHGAAPAPGMHKTGGEGHIPRRGRR